MNLLQRIVAVKRDEIAQRQREYPLAALLARLKSALPIRPFGAMLKRSPDTPMRLIAELKKASPSKGIFRDDFDAAAFLRAYERSPASALSILTDTPFFQGRLDFLPLARQLTTKPLLRKDFLIDAYQLFEARVYGADAVLLIVAALTPAQLHELLSLTRELGMDALVEVHTETELETALNAGATLIGINNRDLTTFAVDLTTTLRLRPLIPDGCVVVSESGIETPEQVRRLADAGVDAILVGETLIRSDDPVAKAKALLGL
ncbi:Indole-3-glycerol phosphate synthase [bacterium HR17]|jgi:indole-3-glycerol phosphate synthase|uniref:Indole-3-glycerol phosphate synthase n=1 Tax=Candidatus Fervidibacter japonicus TaxID=2035412 RepID=A0A2H5XED7_9BACT|nr:Indole-3-glycerol phosphate synthase [bacterium HR17]